MRHIRLAISDSSIIVSMTPSAAAPGWFLSARSLSIRTLNLFPLGTMDTFTTYGGPANLLEAANTMGLPLYARQHLDEKGRWIDLMTEASILPVNKRPRIAIRIHTSN